MKWIFLNLKGSPIMIYISNLVSRRCRTSFRFAAALISSSVLLFGASLALSGCASSQKEQRYSWPLATASPEDTVTQLFAEKFAEEVHDLSNGAMRIQVYANSTLGGDRDLLETSPDYFQAPDPLQPALYSAPRHICKRGCHVPRKVPSRY